jgi:hypothetical protein
LRRDRGDTADRHDEHGHQCDDRERGLDGAEADIVG